MDDFARFLAFEQRLLERLSTRIESFAYGVAFIDDEFPTKYDANFLRVNDPVPGVAADELVSEAERILATHEHREIVMCDDTDGIRLAPEFVARAWVVDRNMFMTLRREPDRLGAIEIEELPFSEVRPLLEEGNRREPWGSDHETVCALTDYQGKLERVIGARSFAARVRGRLAGSCELYVDGDDAQVESVGTLEELDAEESRVLWCFGRSRRHERRVLNAFSSSPTKPIGRRTCMCDSASIGSGAHGSTRGGPRTSHVPGARGSQADQICTSVDLRKSTSRWAGERSASRPMPFPPRRAVDELPSRPCPNIRGSPRARWLSRFARSARRVPRQKRLLAITTLHVRHGTRPEPLPRRVSSDGPAHERSLAHPGEVVPWSAYAIAHPRLDHHEPR